MKNLRLLSIALFVLALQSAGARCQQLTVQTEAGKPSVLMRADLESLPHVKVTTSKPGTSTVFEGVALEVVLEKAGVQFGETLRGTRMASCLLVEAADGFVP